MKVTISRATEYPRDNSPVESYDLEVETGGIDEPLAVVATYLELRDKLDRALKEGK